MRLFVAIRFSPAVRAVLLDAVDALRRQGQGKQHTGNKLTADISGQFIMTGNQFSVDIQP